MFGIATASSTMVPLDNFEPDVRSLIDSADIIDGVAFTKLTDVLDFKTALGREKDKADIILIENFLKLNPNPHLLFT